MKRNENEFSPLLKWAKWGMISGAVVVLLGLLSPFIVQFLAFLSLLF